MSKCQVFKTVPDHRVVFEYLDLVCSKYEKIFHVDEMVFKRLLYNDKIYKLYDYLEPFYHKSKQKYLHTSYKGFLTVLRQICQVLCITYVSKIIYHDATYSNILLIYIDRNNWQELPQPLTVVM